MRVLQLYRWLYNYSDLIFDALALFTLLLWSHFHHVYRAAFGCGQAKRRSAQWIFFGLLLDDIDSRKCDTERGVL